MKRQMSADPIADDSPIGAVRALLVDLFTQLSGACAQMVTIEAAQRIRVLRFRCERVAHRLRLLEEGAASTVTVYARHSPADLLRAAFDEVSAECERRHIQATLHFGGEPPETWLDLDLIMEALRCVIDHALDRIGDHGRIVSRLRTLPDAVEIAVEHDHPGPDRGDLWLRIASRLLDPVEGQILHRSRPRGSEIVLRLEAAPDARDGFALRHGGTRRWIFPMLPMVA